MQYDTAMKSKQIVLFTIFTILLMVLSYFLFEALATKQDLICILILLIVLILDIMIISRFYFNITKNYTRFN
jgi:hypothetical protein